MAENIFDLYRNGVPSSNSSKGENIFDIYRNRDTLLKPPENPVYPKSLETGVKEFGAGTKEGLLQIGDVLDPALSKAFGIEPTGEKRAARRKEYEQQYGESIPAEIGKVVGPAIATAPLVPVRGIQIGMGAAKVGAPALNRLGATITTGIAGGGAYGALTSPEESRLGVVGGGEGYGTIAPAVASGAVAAPILAGANKLGASIIPGVRSMMASGKISRVSDTANVAPTAVKNTLEVLKNVGLTPQEASILTSQGGIKTTLADLAPSITTEASGLASLGGKPTEILKGRFGERADQATGAARSLIETRLGPKPDLEAEKEAIVKQARALAGPDYRTAHKNTTPLNPLGVVDYIDGELQNAVGARATVLKQIKGFFYNEDGTLKNTVKQLHPIREEIDDIMRKKGDALGSNTFSKVDTARKLLDTELKSVPEMKAADAVFSKHMAVKDGLQIGYSALTKKTNAEEFQKAFNAASPDMQETIRKGLRTAIGDVMEGSGQGLEGGMRQLFNKKNVNQQILKTAFGAKGESVIDAVHKEVAERGTERAVMHGSQTAERLSIQEKYKGQPTNIKDFGLSAALDAYAAGGMATGATIATRGLTNRLVEQSTHRLGRLTEGIADLLSRQGAERDVGISVIDQVYKIQNRLAKPSILERTVNPMVGQTIGRTLRLPTLPAPIGSEAYKTYGKANREF